jgi:hypothetical protein
VALSSGVTDLGLSQQQDSIAIQPLAFHHQDEFREGDGFLVVADRRVFAAMALLNAAGYDEEIDGLEMHPLRVRVRSAVAAALVEHGDKVDEWREFYRALDLPVFAILDYVLSLNTDYPFRRVRPLDELQYPTTEPTLRTLPAVLNDFWSTARLEQVWSDVKPALLEELERYDFDKMQRQMDDLWTYLGMPRSDPFVLVNVPNLLERHYTAQGAQYDNFYFQVESAGAHNYGLNVHEYLHSIVNPLVRQHFDDHAAKLQVYYERGREGPYARSYQSPRSMTQESLVRALDYRLRLHASADADAATEVEARIAEITDAGLAMTRPFYQLLEQYEAAGVSFDAFVPRLLELLPAESN